MISVVEESGASHSRHKVTGSENSQKKNHSGNDGDEEQNEAGLADVAAPLQFAVSGPGLYHDHLAKALLARNMGGYRERSSHLTCTSVSVPEGREGSPILFLYYLTGTSRAAAVYSPSKRDILLTRHF